MVSLKFRGKHLCRKLGRKIRSPLEGTHVESKKQDRRKWIVVAGLMPLAVLLAERSILNFETPTKIVPTCSTQENTPNSVAGKKTGRHSASFDPTLYYAQLEQTENERYENSGRNIFRDDTEGKPKRIPPAPTPTPPAPAIQPAVEQTRLRFFGFALIFNSPRKVFLREGDAIFVGSEGEIVDRRYRIARIDSNSVEVEDLIDHSVHTLSLPG